MLNYLSDHLTVAAALSPDSSNLAQHNKVGICIIRQNNYSDLGVILNVRKLYINTVEGMREAMIAQW